MQTTRRRERRRAFVAIATLALLAASCGTRRDHDEILAAATAGGPPTATAAAGAAGSTTGSGTVATGTVADGSTAGGATAPSATGGSSATVPGATLPGDQTGGDGTPAGPGAATGSPIRVGVVGTLSGAAGASLGTLPQGVQVWARWINDHGGVSGHPIDVVVADDGGDPARHRALVQEFVEQRDVLAFLANPEALTGAGSVEYLTSVGVPVIGGDGAGDWFYDSPVYFPQASSGDALLQSGAPIIADIAIPQGWTKVSTITCVEVQVCRDAHDTAPAGFADVGMEVVYQAQSSLAQPDFTAQCVASRDRGAQVMVVAMDANAVRAVAQACARQGFHPMYTFSAGQTTAALGTDPNLDGALVTSNVAAWTSSDTPSTAEFQQAMAAYAPGVTATGGHMQGWVAGKVFELGTRALPADPTSADIVAGLGHVHGDLLPDLTAPLLFRPGQTAQESVCNFAVRIQGGNFATSSAGRVCREFVP